MTRSLNRKKREAERDLDEINSTRPFSAFYETQTATHLNQMKRWTQDRAREARISKY